MSAWKRRTTFAPTQGLHISGYVPSKHKYCNSHISSYEWKIWIITTRQLRVHVTLFFPYFSYPYFIKTMATHIGQHISQATEMQTLCWSKTRPSFSGAHNSYISWSINTIFLPQIDIYNRINNTKTDFIFLKIWCNSVIFCQRGHFFCSPCILGKQPTKSRPVVARKMDSCSKKLSSRTFLWGRSRGDQPSDLAHFLKTMAHENCLLFSLPISVVRYSSPKLWYPS